jgi:hypothetical protein
MAPKSQRQLVVIFVALIVVLLGAGWYLYAPSTAEAPAVASKEKSSTKRGAAATGPRATAPDVHLEALDAEAAKHEATTRNPFRFRAKPAPPPPPAVIAPPPPVSPPAPTGPPPPPPVPPITLKFIGVIGGSGPGGQKVAMLVDGQGHSMNGREGDIIEGRYKIIRIGVESIEMSYLDGRGRQTIRMGGM